MAAKAASSRSRDAIYVVAGKDRFLVEMECVRLLDELIPESEREMGLVCPDVDKADVAEVLDELRTPGLLAPNKVVLLKSADEFVSDNREILERYFDKPSRSGVLVLAVASWPKNTRLAKKLTDVGELVTVAELKPWHMPDFVVRYAAEKHQKSISRTTAGMLVELAGDEPGMVAAEVDKLAMFATARKNITTEDVTAVVGRNRLFDAFEVIDAMTAGETGKALERLRSMLSNDREAEYKVVGAFAWHFRRMFSAKAMLAGGSDAGLVAQRLNIRRDKDSFFNQLRRTSLADIGCVLRELAAIDHGTKTGGSTAGAAIERLVVAMGAKTTAPAAGKRRQ